MAVELDYAEPVDAFGSNKVGSQFVMPSNCTLSVVCIHHVGDTGDWSAVGDTCDWSAIGAR